MRVLQPYLLHITLAVATLVLIQFFLLLNARARLNKLSHMVRSLFAGPGGADLEAMLKACLSESRRALDKGDHLETRLDDLTLQVRGCIQHFGLVRYDAFGDVSGQQSFSLAVLDAERNGAVISGLFSRADSRCYGKAIITGAPEQALTEEEQRALDIALSDVVSAPMEADTSTGKKRLLRR